MRCIPLLLKKTVRCYKQFWDGIKTTNQRNLLTRVKVVGVVMQVCSDFLFDYVCPCYIFIFILLEQTKTCFSGTFIYYIVSRQNVFHNHKQKLSSSLSCLLFHTYTKLQTKTQVWNYFWLVMSFVINVEPFICLREYLFLLWDF